MFAEISAKKYTTVKSYELSFTSRKIKEFAILYKEQIRYLSENSCS